MFKTPDGNATQPERHFKRSSTLAVRQFGRGLEAELVEDTNTPPVGRGAERVPAGEVDSLTNYRGWHMEGSEHLGQRGPEAWHYRLRFS